ncbi:kinase-like protein [Heliocybe sulcata]|uniref:non-specific serine/threonine protein kinase n=1 Tax=Heliocybe sulcata TaxID=5364 RepID=A0A5C3N616_9AGAM|nr:kinase-like protein [Heliocybe sulcata]
MFLTIKVKWFKTRHMREASPPTLPSAVEEAKEEPCAVHAAPASSPEYEVLSAVYEAQVSPEVLNIHSDTLLRMARAAADKLEEDDKLAISVSSSTQSYGSVIITNIREPFPFQIADPLDTHDVSLASPSPSTLEPTNFTSTPFFSQDSYEVLPISFSHEPLQIAGDDSPIDRSAHDVHDHLAAQRRDLLRLASDDSIGEFGPTFASWEYQHSSPIRRQDPLRIANDDSVDLHFDSAVDDILGSPTISRANPLQIAGANSEDGFSFDAPSSIKGFPIAQRRDPLRIASADSEDDFGFDDSAMDDSPIISRQGPLQIASGDSTGGFAPAYSLTDSLECTPSPVPAPQLLITSCTTMTFSGTAAPSLAASSNNTLTLPAPGGVRSDSITEEQETNESGFLPIVRVVYANPELDRSTASTSGDTTYVEDASTSFLTSTSLTRVNSTTTVTPSPPTSPTVSAKHIKLHVDLAKEYKALKQIGSGGFGTVYLIRHKATSKLSAVKVILKEKSDSQGRWDPLPFFMKEQKSARIVGHHPFVIGLEASWHDSNAFYLMTPYYPGGDLEELVNRCGALPETRVRFYLAQLTLAMEHLHSHKIIHRDIKPPNVLIDAAGNAILADLGLCHIFPDSKVKVHYDGDESKTAALETCNPGYNSAYMCHDPCGSAAYASPELLAGQPFSFNTDIWSLGVTAYAMRCCRLPWEGLKKGTWDVVTSTKQILRDPLAFKAGDKVSQELQDLLHQMLEKKPQSRATISDIKEHTFLKEIDWNKLVQGEIEAPYIPAKCKSTPRSFRNITLPLGKPYSPGEDPNPELSFRSPQLDDFPTPTTNPPPSSPPESFHGIGVIKRLIRKLINPSRKYKRATLPVTQAPKNVRPLDWDAISSPWYQY